MRETEELMKNRGIPIDQFVSPEELTERLGQRHIFYRDNDYSRRKIEEFAEEKGIQLPELPEIEELDFYDEVGDITVHLYGKGTNGLFSGKFIFDFNREKEDYSIIFNNHREYHCDIGFYPKGGGWMKIDERNKKIEVKDSSSDFGYEPRLITALTLIEAFPDYTIDVRS